MAGGSGVQRFDLPLADPASAAALASAARAARRFLVSRRMFRASVTGHEVSSESYDRVLYSIEHRQLGVRVTPGGNGPLRPLPSAVGLDAWSVNADTVEDDTRVVAACRGCAGSGEVACPTCHGSTHASCSHCFGGQVFSRQKGRVFKNCPHCRGRGTQRCTNCRGGRVGCQDCNATGRVTAWLTLERRLRSQVTVYPRNAAAGVHRWIDVPDDFDSAAWPNRLSADTGVQPSLKVPGELAPVLDAGAERVVAARRQTFCTDVHRFAFGTPVGGGRIDVAGEPPMVSSSSRWAGLYTRLALSAAIALFGIAGVICLRGGYVARHVWYEQHGSAGPLVGFGIGASLCLGIALALVLVVRIARSWIAIGTALGAVAVFSLGVVLACTYKQPSAEAARRELAAGNWLRARDEAQALVDLRREIAGGEAVLDELHLQRMQSFSSISELITIARQPWHGDDARGRADKLLRTRVLEASSKLHAMHDFEGLARLAAEVEATLPDLGNAARWLAAVVHGRDRLEAIDLPGAIEQLDSVVKLAGNAPPPMLPADAPQITAAAVRLDAALVATSAKSLPDRAKALVAAVEPAREYARLVGIDPDSVEQGLGRERNQVLRQLAAAARWAQKQKAERERQAAAAKSQAEDAAPAAPVDPYGGRPEGASGAATPQPANAAGHDPESKD